MARRPAEHGSLLVNEVQYPALDGRENNSALAWLGTYQALGLRQGHRAIGNAATSTSITTIGLSHFG
jgi:hypothetical protein